VSAILAKADVRQPSAKREYHVHYSNGTWPLESLLGNPGCDNLSTDQGDDKLQYDADEQPDPDVWLELDEAERLDSVSDYHRRSGVRLENPEPHAMAHVVVENQVALGEATSVPEALNRLIKERLDRHDAVHAIGSVLMRIIFDTVHERDDASDINAKYRQELATLTAANWRSEPK
jgi:Domain of unknown function (DUF1841)